MTRMLGRRQVPGCCPGTRKGLPPGRDCSGGGSMTARYAKRTEARQVEREIAEGIAEYADEFTEMVIEKYRLDRISAASAKAAPEDGLRMSRSALA